MLKNLQAFCSICMGSDEILVKLLVENRSGEFLLREGGFPGSKVGSMLQRFEEAGRLASELGLNPNSFQDMVRLKEVSEDVNDIYVIHVSNLNRKPEGEGVEWAAPENLAQRNLSRIDSFLHVPVNYTGEYLSEQRDYRGDVSEIEVVKTLIRDSEGKFLAVKKSHAKKVNSGEKFDKYGRMSGKWELQGGRIGKKPGENRFEAAKREIKEEIGIKLTEKGRDVMREDIQESNLVKTYITLHDE